jgi:hypothetical protein
LVERGWFVFYGGRENGIMIRLKFM